VRLLHLIHTLDPATGGPPQAVRQLAAAGSRAGWTHGVATLDAGDRPWLADFPGPVHAIGPAHTRWGWAPGLPAWLRGPGRDWDLWVVHGLWQFHGPAARAAARDVGRRYAVVPHGMLDPWFGRAHPLRHLRKRASWPLLERPLLRDAAVMLCTTDEEARLAPLAFAGLQARTRVVGLGLCGDTVPDAAAAPAQAFLERHPQLRGRRVLLFLGRLHAKKAPLMLLQAFADSTLPQRGFALAFAGPDGGMRDPLGQAIVQRGLQSHAVLCGPLAGAAKWAALRAADAFVLPSHQENFGLAVAEALAAGTPALLSRQVQTWPAVVRHGAGLATEAEPVALRALLEQWARLAPAQVQAMRDAAPRAFRAEFEMHAVVRRWHAVLEQARHESPAAAAPR
jgi:glycosyltransferase involved in cell wall biosynthesis